jgi:plastocyanin
MNRARVLGALGAFGAAAAAGRPPPAAAQLSASVRLRIYGPARKLMGPDKLPHVAYVPSEFEVDANRLITVTVINEDHEYHTMTCPGLAIDQEMTAADMDARGKIVPVRTTFTFTASQSGVYRWFCRYACDQQSHMWAMGAGYTGRGKEGFMSGRIIVI